jgi:hypothetical protein
MAIRATWRHVAIVVVSLQAVAVAIWLIPASLHVVRWPAAGPVRVGLFASQARLVWLLLGATAGGLAVALFAQTRSATITAEDAQEGSFSGSASSAVQRIARVLSPLSLLWLWTLPYLPWLPETLPTLFVLSGPLRWAIAAGAVAAALMRAGRLLVPARSEEAALSTPSRSRRRRVFAFSLVFYTAFGWLNMRTVGPGGDEPHYLIISQSLLADGDLKIENNHQRREYRAFWGGELRPDYMKRGIDGEIYSIHAPGLPVLLLPAYAVAGYSGTVLVLCLMAALAAAAIYLLAEAIAGVEAALIAWAAVCLTVPFVPHAWLVFPEMPGAMIVAWALWWLWQSGQPPPRGWVLRGAALAALPWLHTKFVIFLAVFGAAFLWRLRGRPALSRAEGLKAVMAFAAPIAFSVAAWLYFFHAFYGTIDPEAPYGDYPAMFVLAKNIPRGLLGLMFDQKFGLLFYSPIYLFAIIGSWLLLRDAQLRWFGVLLLTIAALHVASTARLYMWWGGTSAPARFLVPILPCLAPMIAVSVAAIQRASSRAGASASVWAWPALLMLCLIGSQMVALAGIVMPGRLLLFSDSRGYSRLLETIQAGAPFTFSLPSFTYEDWHTPLIELAPWLMVGAVTIAAMVIAARWLRRSTAGLAAVGCLTLMVTAGLVNRRVDADPREELARRGALDLMWHYDANRSRAFDYEALRKIDETAVRARSEVTFDEYPVRAFALRQGSYEARVWFAGALQREGEIVVTSAQRLTLARRTGTLTNPASVPFELPVDVGRLTIDVADKQVADSVSRVEIVPTVFSRGDERVRATVRRIEAIPERPLAYLIYVDDHSYPEGGVFWTRGLQRSEVLVAPGPYSKIRLTLHLGPNRGDVQVAIGSEQQIVKVEPNSSAEVEVNVPAGARLFPVIVQSPTSFRPADVDPASGDARTLGVQMRVTVE